MKKLLVLSLALCMALCTVAGGVAGAANADTVTEGNALSIQAKSALLMDYNTGTVVYAQN